MKISTLITFCFILHSFISFSQSCELVIEFNVTCHGAIVAVPGTVTTNDGQDIFTICVNGRCLFQLETNQNNIVQWIFTPDEAICDIVSGTVGICTDTVSQKYNEVFATGCDSDGIVPPSDKNRYYYFSSNNVISQIDHSSNNFTSYKSDTSICFNSGFEVSAGTEFEGYITDGDCNNLILETFECDAITFSRWFGGDDREIRTNYNTGFGQGIKINKSIIAKSFSIDLAQGFEYAMSGLKYPDTIYINLTIRDNHGNFLDSMSTKVPPTFEGGWVDFDISLFNKILWAGNDYIFSLYVLDAETLNVNSGVEGGKLTDDNKEYCNGIGYSSSYFIGDELFLDDWEKWYAHGAYFNYRLTGDRID